MIILENLLYLLSIVFVVLLFAYTIKIIYLYLRQIFQKKQIIPHKSIFNVMPNTQSKKWLLIAFILFNISMQISNRNEWINKTTIHHDAKEYFVTNLSLQFYRKILNNFFPIDSIVMRPLNQASKFLYNKGEKFLPRNDGEIYYWKYRFFNYFYIRGKDGYVPDYNPYQPKPVTIQQTEIFSSMYDVIKSLAILKIKDTKIDKEKYKAYIATANYYVTYRHVPYGEYVVKRLSDVDRVALYDKHFMQKNRNILKWTLRFQKEYREDSKLTKFIEKDTPVLGVSYYYVINSLIEDILFKTIIEKGSLCDSRMIDIYINSARSLVSDSSPLFNMSKSQQILVKEFIFNTNFSYLIKYKLNTECNQQIKVGYPSKEWVTDILPSMKKRWLNEEIEKLEFFVDTNSTDNLLQNLNLKER
jgi:hypothetical protein